MYIQKEPICLYWSIPWGDSHVYNSSLYFHADYPRLTFSEFILYIVIPKVEDLQKEGHIVKWGYVDSSDHRDGLESYKEFLELEIEYERKNFLREEQGNSPAN